MTKDESNSALAPDDNPSEGSVESDDSSAPDSESAPLDPPTSVDVREVSTATTIALVVVAIAIFAAVVFVALRLFDDSDTVSTSADVSVIQATGVEGDPLTPYDRSAGTDPMAGQSAPIVVGKQDGKEVRLEGESYLFAIFTPDCVNCLADARAFNSIQETPDEVQVWVVVPHDSATDAVWQGDDWPLNLIYDTPDGQVAKAFGVSDGEPLYVAVSLGDAVLFRFAGLIGDQVLVQLADQVAATSTNTTVTVDVETTTTTTN